MASRYKPQTFDVDETSSLINNNSKAILLMKKFKNLIILALIMTVFLVFSLYTYKLYVLPATHTEAVIVHCDYRQDGTLEAMTQGDIIEQTFTANNDEISSFSVNFATYRSVTDGLLNVSLKDTKTGEIYFDQQVNVSEIEDNTYRSFKLQEPLIGVLDKEFSIVIELVQANADTKISTWKMENSGYTDGKLLLDGSVVPNSNICFRIMSGENLFLKPMYLTCIAIMCLVLLIVYYLSIMKKLKVEQLFLCTAIFLGLFYMTLFTPFSAPDEGFHIGSSYKYSNVLLGYGFDHNGLDYVREGDFVNVPLYKTPNADTYRYFGENLFTTSSSEEMKETLLPYAGNVCQYLFSTAGITLARILKLGYLPMLMLGRLFNFTFFLILTYISIKRIPFGKIALCSIALMPMTISLAISFSYDTVITTLTIFFISTVIYTCYSDKSIRWWDIASLCLSGGLLAAAKAGVYIFICLIVLMIPIKKVGKKSRHFFIIASILASCMIFTLAFNLINVITATTQLNTVESMDVYTAAKETYTISSIFAYPRHFIKMFVDTINNKGEFYIFTLLGNRLGWLNVIIPTYVSMLTGIILLLSSVKLEDEVQFITARTKFLLCAISAIIFFAFVVVAYTWTPQGYEIIEGVQGRYFIPILPIILLSLRNSNLTLKRPIDGKLVYSLCLVNVITLMFAFQQIISGSLTVII